MTNREKYAEQILDIACIGGLLAIGKNTMKLVSCADILCEDCYFGMDVDKKCGDACREWCESEYEEPSIDWSKVHVDTPILVMDSECGYWAHRYFAKYENGQVYAWCDGCTSWSKLFGDEDCSPWKYAKLAEDGDKT